MKQLLAFALFVVACSLGFAQITVFPYNDDFEDTTRLFFETQDLDGDGTGWLQYYSDTNNYAQQGKGCIASLSIRIAVNEDGIPIKDSRGNDSIEACNPDNFLTFPAFTIPADALGVNFYFWVAALNDVLFEEHYDVYISTRGGNFSDFTDNPVMSETLTSATWQRRVIDLTHYRGRTIWIGIRHRENWGASALLLDNISVQVAQMCEPITTYPYIQDFEGNIDCWTSYNIFDDQAIEDAGWSVYSTPVHNYGHNHSSCVMSFSANTYGTDHWLISPAFHLLPNAETILLSWWERNGNEKLPAEHYEVIVGSHPSYDSLRYDTVVRRYTMIDKDTAWKQVFIDLTEYSGKVIYIAFRHCATDAQLALRIDDIRIDITGGDSIQNKPVESISNANMPQLTIYPNPTQGAATIVGAKVNQVVIVDMVGNIVARIQDNNRLDLSNLSAGAYTLHITTPQGTQTRMIIKH
ncbi:MAG: choice-of-anchor J domain-containing protein [Bacteroidales bacterium]|nr:choice-of-anchor J domain-containing protein [Candidatus Colimorpha onthohippi]